MAGMIGLRTAPGIKKCELIPILHRRFAIDDGFQRFEGDLRFQAPVKFTRMTRNNVGFSRPCPAGYGLNQLLVMLHRIGPFDGRVTDNHRLVVMDDIDDAFEQFRLEWCFVAGIVA